MAKASMEDVKGLIEKIVWFRSTWNEVNSGIVMSVGEEMGEYVDMKCLTPCPGSQGVHVNDIYLTKEDLLSANYERYRAKMDAYRSGIKTVEDLVRFCYGHNVCQCEEYTDWEARCAAREAAKNLLGIELDPDAAKREEVLLWNGQTGHSR